jgi:phosphoribosylaminoimidazole-succinocarboxamide synthase
MDAPDVLVRKQRLLEADRLPRTLFTPSTKATTGHDENITAEQGIALVGEERFRALEQASIALYSFAADHAAARGIILADTKFEFGFCDGELILVDEVCTPDSSRFWPVDGYAPGGPQPSFDKQYVRDWLDATGWDREPPAPALPPEVVEQTAGRYREAYERLIGEPFERYRERMGVPSGADRREHG